MSIKIRKYLYGILILNIIFILLYGFNVVHQKSIKKEALAKRKIALAEALKIPTREIYYGDKFPNHIVHTIDGKEVNISDSERKFKLINIVYSPIKTEYKVNVKYFELANNLQKQINGKEIMYIFLLENIEIKETDKPLLSKIQAKYNIHIAALKDTSIVSMYMVKSLKSCGSLRIFIDKNNIVRFIGEGVEDRLLHTIINNEMSEINK